MDSEMLVRIRQRIRSADGSQSPWGPAERRRPWARMAGMAIIATLAVGACTGGGEEDEEEDPPDPTGWTAPPAPPADPAPGATLAGQFRDSAVSGLDYESGALTGTTDELGRFEHAAGSAVTFRVGGVTLGTAAAGFEVLTPLYLTELTTPSTTTVQIQNRHRFLQMLDRDGDPENGIEISAAVRALAANWTPIDFTVDGIDATLTQLAADASAADGTTHVLPDVQSADDHFFRTYFCSFNGLFRGSYTGSGDNGVVALAVYGTGQMRGRGFSTPDLETFDFEKTSALEVTLFPRFTLNVQDTGATFSGRFETTSVIQGTWSNSPDSGTYTGLRTAVSDDAVYRFTTEVFPQGFPRMLLSFEINAANEVSGAIIDTDLFGTGEPVMVSGSLSGTSVTANGGRFSVEGTFDPAAAPTARSMQVTVNDSTRNASFNATLSGCRL